MKDFAESVGVDQLKELSRILEVCQTSPPDAAMTYGRSGSQFYEAARKAKWNGLGQYPMCRMAMLTANSLCPFQEMEDGLARLIRANDFTKLTKKDSLPSIELAEQMMEGARIMSAQLPEHARLRLIGWHDARVICQVIGQTFRLEGKRYTSLKDAGQVSCIQGVMMQKN